MRLTPLRLLSSVVHPDVAMDASIESTHYFTLRGAWCTAWKTPCLELSLCNATKITQRAVYLGGR